jgi:hypothetical protein
VLVRSEDNQLLRQPGNHLELKFKKSQRVIDVFKKFEELYPSKLFEIGSWVYKIGHDNASLIDYKLNVLNGTDSALCKWNSKSKKILEAGSVYAILS